ncbi:MAG: polyprenyl synthetase family protein [Oscillospiraceae bacterium]|jgi:geranylgeranyl diphosphate synthase type II|nr:polyprenyl synthetase family protein [Oscillospiraceae bacterium]
MKPEHEKRLSDYVGLIENELETALLGTHRGLCVSEAMRYSLLGNGKRLRGVLTLEFCRVFKGDVNKAVHTAAAIEMIHAFSLVHDDLPCMDDDDFRRGKPSCHKQFGEAVALLAGDALLALAFNTAAVSGFYPKGLKANRVLNIISVLSAVTGTDGLIGGQQMDLDFEKTERGSVTEDDVMKITRFKTEMLIRASCHCGALIAGVNKRKVNIAKNYGIAFGNAFQIIDDLLDFEDEKDGGKKTLPLLFGVNAAREKARAFTEKAVEFAEKLPDGDFLKELALNAFDRSI